MMKKRIASLILALALALSLFPAAYAASSANLIVNGGAEEGMAGWTAPDGLWNADDEVEPHGGAMFFWPVEASRQNTYMYQDVSLAAYKPGQTIVLNAWLANYDQSPHDMASVTLEILNGSGSVISADSREQRNPEWLQHTIIRTIPAGAARARVKLTATWFVGSDVDAYFDDISMIVSDERYNMVYITGDKEKAAAGETIRLVADNSVSKNPADYAWSSSYDAIATVGADGAVTFFGTEQDSISIYAQDKKTGVTGVYRINSDVANEKPAVGEASGWAAEELARAEALGLIPDALVGADLTQDITRAEFAAVAVRVYEALSGVDALPELSNPFADTKDVEVLKAYNIGAVNGTSATTFSPGELLNREQAATMLTRVFKRVTLTGWTLADDARFTLSYTMPAPFADDADISAWAKDSVYFMAANRIIGGVGANKFAPQNITSAQQAEGYANATREQALLIAVRMVENLG